MCRFVISLEQPKTETWTWIQTTSAIQLSWKLFYTLWMPHPQSFILKSVGGVKVVSMIGAYNFLLIGGYERKWEAAVLICKVHCGSASSLTVHLETRAHLTTFFKWASGNLRLLRNWKLLCHFSSSAYSPGKPPVGDHRPTPHPL